MIPATMQAIRVEQFGDADVLTLQQIAVPTPAATEVLVKIHASGVNPVDTYIRSGTYAIKPQLPYTPGSDAAGVIVAVGNEVKGFSSGDRVYTTGAITGTCAEYALCYLEQLFHLPDNTGFAQGAALGVPAATAWRALFIAGHARAGQTLLIHGASGAVGSTLLQLAKDAGLRVIATAGSEKGRQLVATLGADTVLDHHQDYPSSLHDNPPDLIIDMLANANLPRDLELVGNGGTIVVVGNRGEVKINPRLLMQKEATLKGVLLFAASNEEYRHTHQGIIDALQRRALTPVIGARFTLAQASEAHQAAMTPGHHGKVVITPVDSDM